MILGTSILFTFMTLTFVLISDIVASFLNPTLRDSGGLEQMWLDLFQEIKQRKILLISLLYTLSLVCIALIAPIISPYEVSEQNLSAQILRKER